ncbi:MAG: hypothetical protein ACRDTG_00020 [Pseudonocardiaceae bacterium]
MTTTRQRWRGGPRPGPPAPTPAPLALHIQLTGATQEHPYWLRIWLQRDRFECIWAPERPVDLAGARDRIKWVLSTAKLWSPLVAR